MTGMRPLGYLLLAAGLVLAVIAGWSAWRGVTGLHASGDAGSASSVARDFVIAAGTFGPETSGDYLPRLSALSGGDLRVALGSAHLDASAANDQRSAQTDVEAVSFEASGRDVATALVTATQQRHWIDAGGSTHQQVREQLRLQLARDGGRWVVTDVALMNEETLGSMAGQ